MSDAPAAPVTENGVPPVAQEIVDESPEFKVFAGNLAYSTTDEGLKAFFAPVLQSEILSAQIILRGHRSAGYGFVALSSAEAVQNAVEQLHKTELDGRQVIIEVAKPADQKNREKRERRPKRRPGRRGGKPVPGEVTEAEANGEAPKAEEATDPTGPVPRKIKKRKKFSRKPKVKAEEEAAATPEAEGAADDESAPPKTPRIRKPRVQRPPRPAGEDPVGEPSKTMLFIANLGFSVDDNGLFSLFTEAGINVVSARIVRRRWHPRKSKGYGFVDVGSEEEQKKAIELLHDKEVGGRTIVVKVAVNTQQEDNDEKPQAEGAAPVATA
ncbi:hypothetical protein AX15_006360 [Amanita polypyramis BW_CC]|nr:hypothetical protein AX15_006360 [Amanita polypyramis BW_CC]